MASPAIQSFPGSVKLKGQVKLKPVSGKETDTDLVVVSSQSGNEYSFEGEFQIDWNNVPSDVKKSLDAQTTPAPTSAPAAGPVKKAEVATEKSAYYKWAKRNAAAIGHATIMFELAFFTWAFMRPYSLYNNYTYLWAGRFFIVNLINLCHFGDLKEWSDLSPRGHLWFYGITTLICWFIGAYIRDFVP